MKNHVPAKLTPPGFSQPWINQDLKRLSRRKKKAYNKTRSSNNKADWETYKQVEKNSQWEYRKA